MLPYIVPFEADESVFAGETVQLNCHVSKGDLPLSIKWHFHGFENTTSHLDIMTNKMTSRTSFLSISAATASHSGNYTCVATNRAGSTNHSTVLNVHGQFHLFIINMFVYPSESMLLGFADRISMHSVGISESSRRILFFFFIVIHPLSFIFHQKR